MTLEEVSVDLNKCLSPNFPAVDEEKSPALPQSLVISSASEGTDGCCTSCVLIFLKGLRQAGNIGDLFIWKCGVTPDPV